jgi:dihydrolipoamide dehydrogenase
VRVTLFARGNKVAQLTDPLVLREANAVLAREFDIRFMTKVAHMAKTPDGGGILLTSRNDDGQEKTEQFEYVLAAVGRTPNVDKIGLETAQIELDRHGIPVYDKHTMQCGKSAIFIAGDADNELPLLPEAADQGRIAGDNAAHFPNVKPGLRRTPLTIAFTEPQIATVGATYQQLCVSHAGRFAVGAVSFGNQGRSRVMLQNQGLLRVYAEFGSKRFLGAELIGPRAEHLGHLLAWACQAQLTVPAMLDMPFYHPVVEEGVRTALRELALHLEKDPEHAAGCADCTPAP